MDKKDKTGWYWLEFLNGDTLEGCVYDGPYPTFSDAWRSHPLSGYVRYLDRDGYLYIENPAEQG